MMYALIIALGFIFLLAIGLINQSRNKNYLKKVIQKNNGKPLLYSLKNKNEDNLDDNEYVHILVNEHDLSNPKSDVRRLMKKTGIQVLPSAFTINENGEIKDEKIN